MKRVVLIFLLTAFSTLLYSQEEVIGISMHDLQTNGSSQNRIYHFDDGFIGTTWTYGVDFPSYSDRGTGYNFFNGSSWQPCPTERIESQRAGWPCYAPLGANGEIVVAHMAGYGVDSGLVINKRVFKGEGNWIESYYQGPPNHIRLFWPRLVTGDENHNSIYLLALTAPTSNGGLVYQGLDGALLYSRSTDSGETWDIQNQILPGMDSIDYNGFIGDCYAFAEPIESKIAFVVGSPFNDMFLMKSIDYGQTFEKTIIWDNPYDTIFPTDTFYCVDGSMSVALDISGKAHVVFGIVSAFYNNEWGLNRYTDGIGYWNEDRESFSSENNALNPEGGPGSEMIPDYNLIGWSQDITGNGQVDFVGIGQYGGSHGISGMVQIVIDELNKIFVCFTSVTETFDQGTENYRRLWFRSSMTGGNTWGPFYHYGENDSTSIFNDYIFPSMAANTDDHIYCIFQRDYEPSLNIFIESPSENFICITKIPKDEIVGIEENEKLNSNIDVSQNFPNPFSETTTIQVYLQKPADIKLEVVNMLGEKVYEMRGVKGNIGLNNITIQANDLTPGIYFYTVIAGESSVTKKMLIK